MTNAKSLCYNSNEFAVKFSNHLQIAMPQISLGSRATKDTSQVIDRVVDDEALLIHLQSGNYFSLNDVGTRIWEHLDGVQTIADVAEALALEYDVSLEQAQADTLQLVDALVQENLAVVAP